MDCNHRLHRRIGLAALTCLLIIGAICIALVHESPTAPAGTPAVVNGFSDFDPAPWRETSSTAESLRRGGLISVPVPGNILGMFTHYVNGPKVKPGPATEAELSQVKSVLAKCLQEKYIPLDLGKYTHVYRPGPISCSYQYGSGNEKYMVYAFFMQGSTDVHVLGLPKVSSFADATSAVRKIMPAAVRSEKNKVIWPEEGLKEFHERRVKEGQPFELGSPETFLIEIEKSKQPESYRAGKVTIKNQETGEVKTTWGVTFSCLTSESGQTPTPD